MNNFNGYSNHCPHFLAPLTAVILGAKIIEIHITSDKSKKFVDNNVSFDYVELKNLVKLIRIAETMKL
jgi:sialic acid synthase SpsE